MITAVVLAVALSSGGDPTASRDTGDATSGRTATASPGHTAAPSSPAASASPSIPAPAIGPAGSPAASPAVPSGYSVYTDRADHFSAVIPDTWQAIPENGGLRFCAPGGCPQVIFVQMTALSASWDSSRSTFGIFFATFRPAS